MSQAKDEIAIIGNCCDTGIGFATYDFYKHLPFTRWLVVPHRTIRTNTRRLDENCRLLKRGVKRAELRNELSRVKALFAIQHGYYPGIFTLARTLGIRTVLMPNAEWFEPQDPDLLSVSQFVAPTLSCLAMLTEEGFGDRSVYIPHPIDTDRFVYTRRVTASMFLHCRGRGGYKERKGTDLVFQAARLCNDIPFIIRSQTDLEHIPGNAVVHMSSIEPEEQYMVGDICIQPSRWEGVGLQILEAMACGLPTIVPDAAPMNEYPTDRQFCVPARSTAVTVNDKSWVSWEIDPDILASTIRELYGSRLTEWSIQAREKMELRSWARLKAQLGDVIGY